jgi:hydroxymethylpyrimidine/phosphomethylpyrimidine kinase
MQDQPDQPVVLTVAGFDPTGGAGVIADIRTALALGCRPVAAITSVTSQNSAGVFLARHQNAESLRAQILAVLEEFTVAALKIGMLPTRELVVEIARLLDDTNLPAPILDPVLRSSSGYQLMETEARQTWLAELMPRARLITPNIPEAEMLLGTGIDSESGMLKAARLFREMGARSILVKGGHLIEDSESGEESSSSGSAKREAIDVLNDEGAAEIFRGEWIDVPPVRGTGCMLASGIAAGLARGMNLHEAVSGAKSFVADAIRNTRNSGATAANLRI